MAYLIAGPLVALVGIVAVFFVLRRKSVEKRSMYSARRSQIEHKVRAARQRTLAPHGRTEKVEEPAAGPAAPTSTWVTPPSSPEASCRAATVYARTPCRRIRRSVATTRAASHTGSSMLGSCGAS